MCQPTYVYPEEVKMLLRSVFSQNICDYPDPCHDNVSRSSFRHSFGLTSHDSCAFRISSESDGQRVLAAGYLTVLTIYLIVLIICTKDTLGKYHP